MLFQHQRDKQMVELLSIDLSNYCSKQCEFCYNHSTREGNVMWTPAEVVSFAKDCVANGVKAISLGGGEPFEYDGIFEIIDELQPIVYLSVTTNGLPLENDESWNLLLEHQPDKVHVTIHQPDNESEVERVLRMLRKLSETEIKPGVNLLVNKNKVEHCASVYRRLRGILNKDQIILVPQRFSDTPSPQDLAVVSGSEAFQAPSCLLKCAKPQKFVSVSWNKKVNFCSYADGKQKLESLDFNGLMKALGKVDFIPCNS